MVDDDRPTKVVFNRKCKIQSTVFIAVFWILMIYLVLNFKHWIISEDTQIDLRKLTSLKKHHLRTSGARIVGYYHGDYETAKIRLSEINQLTHIVFVTKIKNILDFEDPEKKIKNFQRFLNLKKKIEGYKTGPHFRQHFMISIFDDGREYSVLTRASRSEQEKVKFINSISKFMKTYNVGGLDMDWNLKDSKNAVDNQLQFLKTLRDQFPSGSWSNDPTFLSVSIPPYGPLVEEKMNLTAIYKAVNWINVQTDNYRIPMGPPAPLNSPTGSDKNRSISWTMQFAACKCKDWEKLNLVVSFKTRVWENVEIVNDTFTTDQLPYDVPYSTISKTIKYYELQKWDAETNTSYIYLPSEKKLMQLETPDSVFAKLTYIRSHDISGVTYRNLEDDNERGEMLSQEKKVVWFNPVPIFGFYCKELIRSDVDWDLEREKAFNATYPFHDWDIVMENDSSGNNYQFIILICGIFYYLV